MTAFFKTGLPMFGKSVFCIFTVANMAKMWYYKMNYKLRG